MISGLNSELRIEEVDHFFRRTRLTEDTPNRSLDDISAARDVVPMAVDFFQSHLVNLRKKRAEEVQRDLDKVLDRLSALETRFKAQLSLSFGDIEARSRPLLTPSEKRQMNRKRAKEEQIDRLFEDWTEWFERTRRMVDDPNPYVDVKAVFLG